MEATPRPWSFEWTDDEHYGEGTISDNHGHIIAIVCGSNHAEWRDSEDDGEGEFKANAALIVKAVNSHQALVDALNKAQEDINWMLNNARFLNPAVFDYIDKALKAAGEEE